MWGIHSLSGLLKGLFEVLIQADDDRSICSTFHIVVQAGWKMAGG